MAESSNKGISIPWSAIFAACTVLGGLFYWLIPVASLRPPTPPSTILSSLGFQDIDARLWQDPLAAAYDRANTEREKPQTRPSGDPLDDVHGLRGMFWNLARSPRKRFVILPVMIPGRPFFEDAETRIRTRVAVTSALGVESYVPDDAEHLGSIYLDWPKTQPQAALATVGGAVGDPTVTAARLTDSSLIVPYEWWHRQENDTDCVLVLWLNEDLFADLPLARLRLLFATILRDNPAANVPSFTRSVIGPARSNTLDAMIDESTYINRYHGTPMERFVGDYLGYPMTDRLERTIIKQTWKPLLGVRVYSAKATAEDDLLIFDADMDKTQYPDLAAILNNDLVGVRFERTTATDRDLCELLYRELAHRGVGDEGRIALVSEWDTYYGRALPSTFAAVADRPGKHLASEYFPRSDMQGQPPGPQQDVHNSTTRPWPSRIYHFSYLRGIDGKLPGDGGEPPQKPNPAPANAASKNLLNPSANSTSGTPEGRDQSDYLIRLADELAEISRNPAEGGGSGEFKAIGVLGSDVYDKLQILQALRPSFPHAIFFTTDLDARLCTASVWKTTHNLVIASSFGLELNRGLHLPLALDEAAGSKIPTLGLKIPPFRDCHQTAIYYATLRAMEDALSDEHEPHAYAAPQALLFEVGRQGPLQLTPPPPDQVDASATCTTPTSAARGRKLLKLPRNVQPSPPDTIPKLETWVVIGVLLVAGCAALLIAFRDDACIFRSPSHDRWTRAGPDWRLAIGVAGGLFVAWALLLVCMVAQSHAGVPLAAFNGLSIWPTEFLRLLAAALGIFFLVRTYRQWKAKPDPPWHVLGPDCRATAAGGLEGIWNDYRKDATPWRSLRRWILLILALTAALPIFGLPHVPYRGWVGWVVDYTVLAACLLVLAALSCFAANAAQQCGTLIEKYSAKLAGGAAVSGVNDLEHLQFLGSVSEPVEQTVYYPFLVLAIVIVSYGSYFADWGLPLTVGFYACVIAAVVLIGAWSLRRAASRAKTSMIERVRDRVLALPTNKPERASLQAVLDEIKEYRKGAFGSISQHPVVAALLLPSSGLGVWALLQYLASS